MSCILDLRVTPGAKKRRWARSDDGQLKCFVTAPAVDGKANKAVIEALSEDLGIAKSKLTILSGHTSRIKRVEVAADFTVQDVLRLLRLDCVQERLF